MKFDDVIILTFKNLAYRRLKSWLTIIGIVLGIASVVGLLTFGEGIQASIIGQLGALGSENIMIFSGGSSRVIGRSFSGQGLGSTSMSLSQVQNSTLTLKDAQTLSKLPGVRAVGYVIQKQYTVTFRGEIARITTSFVNPQAFKDIEDPVAVDGRLLGSNDQLVAFLGSKVAQDYFSNKIKVGDTINIDGVNVRVTGIMDEKGGGFTSLDDYIYLNIDVVKRFVPNFNYNYDFFKIRAVSAEEVSAVEERVRATLRNLHKTKEDDFQIITYSSMMEIVMSITSLITSFLAGIAAISLLVGAIGIANTMFTSVYERTREIGIMKAIGAKSRDVMTLFITEAAIMSLIGGLVGIGLGLLIATGLASSIHALGAPEAVSIQVSITTELIIISILFSLGIGVLSGLFPARRAAKLNPIEAIWYE